LRSAAPSCAVLDALFKLLDALLKLPHALFNESPP